MRSGLTSLQIRLLRSLDTYRLLNVEQMQRVGVGSDLAGLYDATRFLKRRRLVNATRHKLIAGFDHLPALHWLTEIGAATLGTLLPDLPAPIGARRSMKTYMHVKHRMMQVEAHIALRLWASTAGVPVGWFVTDFDRGSRGRGRATTIRYSGGSYTCDAMAEVAGEDGGSRLVVFEIERGTEHEHLTSFRKKLDELRVHAERGLLNAALGIKRPARFAIVFQSAAMRDRMQKTWPDPNARVWGQFFVKTFDELADFNAGWWYPGSRVQRPLFSWVPAAQPQATLPLPVV